MTADDDTPTTASELDLSSYPSARFLKLGMVRGWVASDRRHLFRAPESGQLALRSEQREANLSQGDVWAVMAPESLALEAELLDIRAEVLSRQRTLYESVESPQAQLKVEQQLGEAERQLATIAALDGIAADPELMEDLVPEFDHSNLAATKERLSRQAAILKQEIELLDSGGLVSLAELELAELELKQSRLQLSLRKQQFELSMPFDGVLHSNIDSGPTSGTPFVTKGRLVGVAEDTRTISVSVEMRDAVWLGYERPAMRLIVNLDGAPEIGSFQRSELLNQSGQENFVYHFTYEDAVNERLRNRRNAEIIGELAFALESECLIIPKLDLIQHRPDIFMQGQWVDGVQTLWPNASVRAVGSTELAVSLNSRE